MARSDVFGILPLPVLSHALQAGNPESLFTHLPTRPYRFATHAIAIIMILSWLAGCMMGILICKPIQYSSDKTIPGGHCGDLMGIFCWTSLPNFITDIAMLILPLPMVWKPHTGLPKIGLSLTFITGSMDISPSCSHVARSPYPYLCAC